MLLGFLLVLIFFITMLSCVVFVDMGDDVFSKYVINIMIIFIIVLFFGILISKLYRGF